MYCANLKIKRMSNNRKIFVYRAKTADSINTISKVKNLSPVLVIDEAVAQSTSGKYEIKDHPSENQDGVIFNGPVANIVPLSEYETTIKIVPINHYTYVNAVHFNELETNYNGTMLYYSMIGVDTDTNMITHLSKVNGVLVNSDYKKEGVRHIYSCDDYTGMETDEWKYIGSASWDEDLIIGDISDKETFDRFGNPFVETVPSLEKEKINIDTRPVIQRNFAVLEIQNPWQQNNKQFNYRKLKSFKLQNVEGEQYSDFSEPTFQSKLPVSIEKMIILRSTDSEHPDVPVNIDTEDESIERYEVIRKDGIYYNAKEHKKLGVNKYNIPLGEKIAIFSEGSVQEQIKIQAETLTAHTYSYTFYLIDVYQNVSEPVVIKVTT